MDRFRLRLNQTLDLHDQVSQIKDTDARLLARTLDEANETRVHNSSRLMNGKKLPDIAMTALLLEPDDLERINHITEKLHTVIEKVVNHLVASPELIVKYLPAHQRILPFLSKSPGSDDWQLISRYDLVISPDGEVKVMELNTSCPGGFTIPPNLIPPTMAAFEKLGLGPSDQPWTSVNAGVDVIVDTVLELERRSGISPDLIAVLNDENELRFELDQFVEAFKAMDREARIINARELETTHGRLSHQSQPISATFNKFRISTSDGPNHCWKEGFETRYADFLAAQKSGSVVTVNNLCGMSISEDKSLLSLLFEPEFIELLTEEEKTLVEHHVLWTSRLQKMTTVFNGETIELLDYVRSHKDRFVIKPGNEGRGFGVLIGKYTNQSDWDDACRPNPAIPSVVQEYSESIKIPVGTIKNNELSIDPMFVTLAIAVANGQPSGFISRISTEPVTNVAHQGFPQAVFITE